jgi:hypothetical protein
MTFRRIQLSAVAVVLFTLSLAAGVAQPTDRDGVVQKPVITKHSSATSTADWTFEGCWTRSSAGPCRDVFRDQDGNHWICRDCGTTGKPSPGKCTPISQGTLALGFWCS